MTIGRLADKVAVITGAGSGLGKCTAERFAGEGAAVVCADIDVDAVTKVAANIEIKGGKSIRVQVDCSLERENRYMVEAAIREFGRIDILFANAGVAGVGAAHAISTDDWHKVLATNLTGVWLSCKAVLPSMMEWQGGSIILQSSAAGLKGIKGLAAYAAAKGGVVGLARQMAAEYASHNIRVNAIAPGTILTPLVEETYRAGGGVGMTDSLEDAMRISAERYPLGRIGEMNDVANAALFLASDESQWTTGAIFSVDGGLTGC